MLAGHPSPAQIGPLSREDAEEGKLDTVNAWLNLSGHHDVTLKLVGNALLLDYKVPGLSVISFSYESEDGERVHQFSSRVSNLCSNVVFRDTGLGVVVKYRDFGLALQLVIPFDQVDFGELGELIRVLGIFSDRIGAEPS